MCACLWMRTHTRVHIWGSLTTLLLTTSMYPFQYSYLYICIVRWGSSCLLFVDDRLMVDHFMMIKKMIKMDHHFGSFYDHQKWPRPIINQYTLNLAILGIAHHGFRDRAHTCVNMHQIETFPRARPAYQNIAHLFGVYRSTIHRPSFKIISLTITLVHRLTAIHDPIPRPHP